MRVVGHEASARRFEFRLPGADTNPYLTLSVRSGPGSTIAALLAPSSSRSRVKFGPAAATILRPVVVKESSYSAHGAVLQAIRAADSKGAAAAMRAHLAVTREEFRRLFEDN